MSTDSYIPIYKRSGDGTAKDLLKLKKLEMISDGWYKGQLIKYFTKVFGTTTVDGILCYKTNVAIGQYTTTSDTSEYAINVRKLLALFGMTDDKIADIYDTYTNSQVSNVLINFDKNVDLNREYTEFDFKQAWLSLKDLLSTASKFELVQSNKRYLTSETNRPAVASSNIFSGSAWVIDEDYFGDLQDYDTICNDDGCITTAIPITRNFSLGQAMHYSEIKLYDSLNNNITLNYPTQLVNALKCLLVVSGDKFAQLDSLVKVSESIYTGSNGEYSQNYYVVTSKETYSLVYNGTFLDNEFSRYKKGNIDVYGDGYDDTDSYFINGILANHFWTYYLVKDSLDNDTSNDLFYISKRSWTWGGKTYYDESTAIRYLTVSGLQKTNSKTIASYLAQYTDFEIIRVKKKRSFLGIGGFIGNFLGGIFELALMAVGAIAKILYYIPLVRIQIQFIGWLFSGEWSNDRDRFVQVATRVIFAIAAVLIVIATGGGGLQIALSLLTSAYTMYSGMKEYDDTVAYIKKQEANQTAKELEDDEDKDNTYQEMIDLANTREGLEYANKMTYNPFNGINDTYRSPFNSGVYSPEMGLKMKG